MATEDGTENQLRNLVKEKCASENSDLLQVLQDILDCSCYRNKICLLRKAVSVVEKYFRGKMEEFESRSKLSVCIGQVIDLAIVPAFETRDYFSYCESDFKWYPEIAEEVLRLFKSILLANGSNRPKEASIELSEKDSEAIVAGTSGKMKEWIIGMLPKLSLLVGGYLGKQLWSSDKCALEASQLLQEIMNKFSCASTHELFVTVHVDSDLVTRNRSRPSSKQNNQLLLSWFVSYCEERLSNNKWQRDPFLSQTFVYIVCQIGSPAVNENFHVIRAMSLSFLDDHQGSNKTMGILCLHHLVKHSSTAEMNLLSEGLVIYDALKTQMYSKDPDIVGVLFPCLLDLLALLEKPPAIRHHETFHTILFSAQSENILTLRVLYIKFLKDWVNQMGIACVKHLKTLLPVIGSYLVVNDGVDGENCLGGLKVLHCVLEVAWPRMTEHSKTVVQMLLNVVVSVNYDQWVLDNPMAIWAEISSLATDCVKTLSQINADVIPCIEKFQHIAEEKSKHLLTFT